jgi:hypothetical protein
MEDLLPCSHFKVPIALSYRKRLEELRFLNET